MSPGARFSTLERLAGAPESSNRILVNRKNDERPVKAGSPTSSAPLPSRSAWR